MTQRYVVGELSLLLAELEQAAAEWRPAVRGLRHAVELSSFAALPALADQAVALTDVVCLAALERSDIGRFSRAARSARDLSDLIDNARLR